MSSHPPEAARDLRLSSMSWPNSSPFSLQHLQFQVRVGFQSCIFALSQRGCVTNSLTGRGCCIGFVKNDAFLLANTRKYERFTEQDNSKACRGVALHAGPSDTLLDCALILAAQRRQGPWKDSVAGRGAFPGPWPVACVAYVACILTAADSSIITRSCSSAVIPCSYTNVSRGPRV